MVDFLVALWLLVAAATATMARPSIRIAAGHSRWLHTALAGPSTPSVPRARRDRREDLPTATEKEQLSEHELVMARAIIRQAKQNKRRQERVAQASSSTRSTSRPGDISGKRFNSSLTSRPDKVKYLVQQTIVSNEQRDFFANEPAAGFGEDGDDLGGAGGSQVLDEQVGLEHGRIVECRRSGVATIGMIVANVLLSAKPRLLLLRSSGEIWPVSAYDVQYVLPRSLVPPELSAQAWTADTFDEDYVPTEAELKGRIAARQKIVMTLRKVERETERMRGTLARAKAGGTEEIWRRFSASAPTEHGVVTAVEAAEFLLGKPVRPSSLPAFAAHRILMDRPDLFMADEGSMWESGRFSVRSREDRRVLEEVTRWTREPPGKGPLAGFAERANAIIAVARARPDTQGNPTPLSIPLPKFTPSDLTILSALISRLFEIRSTQTSPFLALAPAIIKATDAYPNQTVDVALIHRFLNEIGVVPAWDSLAARRLADTQRRDPSPFLLDTLVRETPTTRREDFTRHTVYVIDDPTAVELDDGISIEQIGSDGKEYWIHIHVADPTRVISPEHPLARQAAYKVASQYYVEANLPLLDEPVVMREMSLGAKQGDQEVMTFSIRMGSDATFKESTVRLGMIRDIKVISYQQVDQILGGEPERILAPFGRRSNPEPKPAVEVNARSINDLMTLNHLSRAYRMRRLATQGIIYGLETANVSITSALPPPSSIPTLYSAFPHLEYTLSGTHQNDANMLVAECMVMAGQAAARFCSASGVAVPYRTGPTPVTQGTTVLEQLLAKRDPVRFLVDPFDPLMRQLYAPASEAVAKPADHWMMGITGADGGYIRATSPLRRYSDILVHWQIRSILGGTKPISLEEMLSEISRVNRVETRINRAGKLNEQHWRVGYLQRVMAGAIQPSSPTMVDINGPLEGRVLGVPLFDTSHHTTSVECHLASLGIKGKLTRPGLLHQDVWQMGDMVNVKIVSAQQYPAPVLLLEEV